MKTNVTAIQNIHRKWFWRALFTIRQRMGGECLSALLTEEGFLVEQRILFEVYLKERKRKRRNIKLKSSMI